MDGYTIEQNEEQVEERVIRSIIEHDNGTMTIMYTDGTSEKRAHEEVCRECPGCQES